MMEFLEDPNSYLSAYLGEDKAPFSYMYRVRMSIPLALRTNYTSVEEEMITQAPHTLPA
jgi:hypothetical protein